MEYISEKEGRHGLSQDSSTPLPAGFGDKLSLTDNAVPPIKKDA
jgi:hypothetical protein